MSNSIGGDFSLGGIEHLPEPEPEDTEGEDINDKIADHVEELLEQIPQGTPDVSEMDPSFCDLFESQLHFAEQDAEPPNVFKKVQKAVSHTWDKKSKKQRVKEWFQAKHNQLMKLLKDTRIPKVEISCFRFRHCLDICRNFAVKFFRKIVIKASKKDSIPLDLCGLEPDSMELCLAYSIMLRSAYAWTDRKLYTSQNMKGFKTEEDFVDQLTDISLDAYGKVLDSFDNLYEASENLDNLANDRFVTLFALTSPMFYHEDKYITWRKLAKKLAQIDNKSNYVKSLYFADAFDFFCSIGEEEKKIGLLFSHAIREVKSREIGNYIEYIDSDFDGDELNYDIVAQIVNANLPGLNDDFNEDPERYLDKINFIITHLFHREDNARTE